MQSAAKSGSAHPLAELLACPPATANLLNASAQSIAFDTGDAIFRQGAACSGLCLIVSGQLLRKAERMQTRVVLGSVHTGDLVELAAVLGDRRHTYTLIAQCSGSLMMIPMEALEQAFQMYPPLRMQLLQELAREVSRAYARCCAARKAGIRRRGLKPAAADA